jgi:glycosidase
MAAASLRHLVNPLARTRVRLRDWYIWRDGEDPGEPPNNWVSTFGGSAWPKQPEMHEALKRLRKVGDEYNAVFDQ